MSSEQGTQYSGLHSAQWNSNTGQTFGENSPRNGHDYTIAMNSTRPIHIPTSTTAAALHHVHDHPSAVVGTASHSRNGSMDSTATAPTPQWSTGWFSPASSASRALYTPSPGPQQGALQSHSQTSQQFPYDCGIQGMPSQVMFEPYHSLGYSLGLFGGSVAPQYQHPELSRAQHQLDELSPPYDLDVTPETHAARYEHARASLPAHDEGWGQDAPDNAPTVVENKRKAIDEFDEEGGDSVTPELPAAAAKKRRKGTSRGVSATRAASGDSKTTSQSKTRRKRRPNASPSTDDLGPSVQESNNIKPGAKPALPCGVALKDVNATKQAAMLDIIERVRNQALSTDAVLMDLPLHGDRPTVADLKSFKTALAKAVAAEGDVSPTRKICNDCSAEYDTPVPLGPKTKLARHRHDYHSPGLQKCNACGYLVLGRAESMHEHYGRCAVLRPLVETDRHGAWLRKHGLLSPPSHKFFKQEALDIADAVQGDQAEKERALLDWMRTHDYKSAHRAGSHTPAATAASGSGAVAVEHGEEGDEDADGEEGDEDADGEDDVDVDDQIENGSTMNRSAGVHEGADVASPSSEGGSTAAVQSGTNENHDGAEEMDNRDIDAHTDCGDGAPDAVTVWGLIRRESASTGNPAAELTDELPRIQEGFLDESAGAFGTPTDDAERGVLYGDWTSWTDGDVVERTVGEQSALDVASSSAFAYAALEDLREDPYQFHDAAQTLTSEELDDFFA